mgnify:CR=1 FL=1
MEFSNQQIVESELPSVQDIKYRSIEKKHRTVSIIATTIFALVIFLPKKKVTLPFVGTCIPELSSRGVDYKNLKCPAFLIQLTK